MTRSTEKDALRLAADDFEWEADALAKQPGSAEYVRGIRACVRALRERAEGATSWHVGTHPDSDTLFRHSGGLIDCQECNVFSPEGGDDGSTE